MNKEDLRRAAQWLSDAKRVVVLTGAGVSKESGIPTFRDAMTGLWANYNPEELATPEGFAMDPPLVWKWYDWRRKLVSDVQPNPGHFALAQLEKLIPEFLLVTQNVDGLHTRAGSTRILELHGNILRHKCFERGHQQNDVPYGLEEPPLCHCGSYVRPDVVWFGEALPHKELNEAMRAAEVAQVIIVIGTSGLVQPAASIPFVGKRCGAKVIEVNPNATEITVIADVFLAGPSGEVLPELLSHLGAIADRKARKQTTS
ncbi:MAG TPA: NAD-dependent deacylase [Candidatus Obscuribacterales bacterium]